MSDLMYVCTCGYETPISTGMMNHLNMYRKCRWKEARIIKGNGDLE